MKFGKQQQKEAKAAPTITYEKLEELEYSENFDLPREEDKLRAIYFHQRSGGKFDIRKVFVSKGMRIKTIATVARFPTYFDLQDLVEEQYGGGTYRIHAAGSPRLFMTYVINGPPTYNVDKPPTQKSPAQKRKEELEEFGWQCLREAMEENPTLSQAIGIAVFKKYTGVDLPVELGWEEQLFREGVEGDPEIKTELIKARLREKGVEFPEDIDPTRELIRKFEQFKQLNELLNGEPKGVSETLAKFLKEVAPALPEIVKLIREARGTGAVDQGGASLEASQEQSGAQFPVGQASSPDGPDEGDEFEDPMLI